MKTRFLSLILTLLLLQISIFSFADVLTIKRKIKFKTENPEQHRSIPISPDAYIDGTLLYINFSSISPSAIITIKKMRTGEVVYITTDLDVNKIDIDLVGEEPGEYVINIQLSTDSFVGDFTVLGDY